jgi:hypothetical protein
MSIVGLCSIVYSGSRMEPKLVRGRKPVTGSDKLRRQRTHIPDQKFRDQANRTHKLEPEYDTNEGALGNSATVVGMFHSPVF